MERPRRPALFRVPDDSAMNDYIRFKRGNNPRDDRVADVCLDEFQTTEVGCGRS